MTEQEWLSIFASNLASLMKEWGYSQKDLALESGLEQSTISRYLREKQMPNVRAIVNLAYAFDCDFNEFLDFGDKLD